MIRRAFAISAGVALVLTISSGTVCHAARKAKAVKRPAAHVSSKLSVPANIMAGAAVTSGRYFSAPKLPEDTLAGIRLGRPAKEILSRWGNPSRVTVGTVQSQGPDQTQQAGIPYTPPAGGMAGVPYLGGIAAGVNQAAGLLGLQNSPMPSGMPAPGYLPPMTPGMPPAPGQTQPNSGGSSTTLTEEEVTWTYDLQNGITLEFIITDGLITQITVGGQGPWGLSKTRTGLQLGDTYKLVLWVCGYPENQRYAGRFLRASYVNKSRALYTFLNKKLVGITIAMVPQELM